MDSAQRYIFPTFPRRIGVPNQRFILSENHFDLSVEMNQGKKNLYSTICNYTSKGVPIADELYIDLDSPKKHSQDIFQGSQRGDVKIAMMQEDPQLAVDVIGPVLDDAQKIATWAIENKKAMMGVVTGMGIHIHFPKKPKPRPKKAVLTESIKLKEELGLKTVDRAVFGKINQLVRIPNCERMYKGSHTGHYCIPVFPKEILEATPSSLLELAESPRNNRVVDNLVSKQGPPGDFTIYDKYPTKKEAEMPEFEGNPSEASRLPDEDEIDNVRNKGDFDFYEFLKEVIPLPCMHQQICSADPPHFVRRNVTCMLMDFGYTNEEIIYIYRKLNWKDFDEGFTRKMINSIKDKNYKHNSCRQIMERGYCVYNTAQNPEDPKECPTHNWLGGGST